MSHRFGSLFVGRCQASLSAWTVTPSATFLIFVKIRDSNSRKHPTGPTHRAKGRARPFLISVMSVQARNLTVESVLIQVGGFINSCLICSLNQKVSGSCMKLAEIRCCDTNISMMTNQILILGLISLSKQVQKVFSLQKRFGGMHDAHNCTLCSNPKVDIFKIKVLIGYSYKSTSV